MPGTAGPFAGETESFSPVPTQALATGLLGTLSLPAGLLATGLLAEVCLVALVVPAAAELAGVSASVEV